MASSAASRRVVALTFFVLPVVRTYTNAQISNNVVIVPTYNLPTDAAVLDQYRAQLPGRTVIGLNANDIIESAGAWHCVLMEWPQAGRVPASPARTGRRSALSATSAGRSPSGRDNKRSSRRQSRRASSSSMIVIRVFPGDAITAPRMLVWHVYWINGQPMTSALRARLWGALERLKGHGDDAALVLVYTDADEQAPQRLDAFLRRGGVWVDVKPRGGGAKGRDWYQAGAGPTKANTWRDMIACAQAVVRRGYTQPARLAITGTSMGALVGAAYAAGKSPEQIEQLFEGLDWNAVLEGKAGFPELSYRRKEDDRRVHHPGAGLAADQYLGQLAGHLPKDPS